MTYNLLVSTSIHPRQPDPDLPRRSKTGSDAARSSVRPSILLRRDRRTSRSGIPGRVHRHRTVVPVLPGDAAFRRRDEHDGLGLLQGIVELRSERVKAVMDAYYGDDHLLRLPAATAPTPSSKPGRTRSRGCSPTSPPPPPIAGALPLPGEPLPGPGLAVRELPRDQPLGVLPEERLLGGAERSDGAVDRRVRSDHSAVLPVDPPARAERRGLPARDPVRPRRPADMVAWMAASSDPADFGKLTVFRLPEGRNIEGPTQVMSRINQDPTLLGAADAAGTGRGGRDLRRLPRDPDRRLSLYAVPSTCAPCREPPCRS